MAYNQTEPDDPMELVGVVVPADGEAQREMAYVFAEEFVRMGYGRERLLTLFKTPFYAGAYGAYRALGEDEIQAIIDECLNAWGRSKVTVQEVQAVQDVQNVLNHLNPLNDLNVR